MKEYKTVFNEIDSEIIIKKSRFISHIKPINNEQQALDFISEIKSKHWNATHNVYAYIIDDNQIQRYSDDGEPSGTAGMPTLQSIKDMGLTNIVIVTTRYFGGIMLGAGGLIRAYRKSAIEGINEANIVTKKKCTKAHILIDYTFLGKVQSEILNSGIIINNIIYEDNVKVEVVVTYEQLNELKKLLMNILSGDVNIDIIGEVIIALDASNKLLEVVEYG